MATVRGSMDMALKPGMIPFKKGKKGKGKKGKGDKEVNPATEKGKKAAAKMPPRKGSSSKVYV